MALVMVAIATLFPREALADGIDLVAYFSRTLCENIALAIPVAVLLMLVNYGVNFLAIGWPALRLGSLPIHSIARSLVWLTLFGQIADRVGAVLAGFLVGPITEVLGLTGEGAWVVPLLVMNFLFGAISVGILTFVFTRRLWGLSIQHSVWISIGAGILTNPAWAMGLWFLG